jgi:hypothetical protein
VSRHEWLWVLAKAFGVYLMVYAVVRVPELFAYFIGFGGAEVGWTFWQNQYLALSLFALLMRFVFGIVLVARTGMIVGWLSGRPPQVDEK